MLARCVFRRSRQLLRCFSSSSTATTPSTPTIDEEGLTHADALSLGLFVCARERGQERADLPTWACSKPLHVLDCDEDAQTATTAAAAVERVDIEQVPGAFQLLNVLSKQECNRMVAVMEALGFHTDAPVSLPYRSAHIALRSNVSAPGAFTARSQHNHLLVPAFDTCAT